VTAIGPAPDSSPAIPNVGFAVGSSFPPAQLAAVSQAVEQAGFASIWATEDYFLTGGIAGAAVALAATDRVTVGTGLLSVYSRHPALIAMEAATLAAAYPGRFRLGLGVGGLIWLDQQGIPRARPLSAVRGAVHAVRALLAGEELTGEHGGFVFDGVGLAFVPDSAPPIYIGATGPRMTALAGEVGDGLLLSVFSSPEFVRSQSAIVAGASRGPRCPISTFAFLAIDDSIETARALVRPIIAAYLADGENAVMTDAIGITAELRAMVAKGGAAELEASMPADWIDQLAVCGDVDSCSKRISELVDAGSDEVALAPIATDTLARDIARLGSALRTR
jgi:alkanesulfonate monooxygenase SsuD/methylene tetrahydromethanopterin reductase-like flavin-dependent oxidoreductase (luciferase family)